MRGETFRLTAIAALGVIMLAWGCPGFLHGNQWYVAFTHHFFHVGFLHLAVNCLSLWCLFKKGYVYPLASVLVPFLCATASWFVSAVDPVGASNFIYAVIGCRTPSFKSRWWRSRQMLTFLAVTLAMLAFPKVSAVTHIVSFALGVLCAHVARYIARRRHGDR